MGEKAAVASGNIFMKKKTSYLKVKKTSCVKKEDIGLSTEKADAQNHCDKYVKL